jgi:hypothetical protein
MFAPEALASQQGEWRDSQKLPGFFVSNRMFFRHQKTEQSLLEAAQLQFSPMMMSHGSAA